MSIADHPLTNVAGYPTTNVTGVPTTGNGKKKEPLSSKDLQGKISFIIWRSNIMST